MLVCTKTQQLFTIFRFFVQVKKRETCKYLSTALSTTESTDNLIPIPLKKRIINKERDEALSLELIEHVNKSSTLRNLVALEVDLYKLFLNGFKDYILRLEFEKNIQPYLWFLSKLGVPKESFGNFITKNPLIFKEDLDDLQVRINYLESKSFKTDAISRIISADPKWLSHSTRDIDGRLGFFQKHFSLKGREVRFLAIRRPSIITCNLWNIETNTFGFREQMGFSPQESKLILLRVPKLYTQNRAKMVDRFNYLHNEMGISHERLTREPRIMGCREHRIRERHEFLVTLGKAQYNPKLPRYVSLTHLVSGSDLDFCKNLAQIPIAIYNKFLKTR